MFSTNSFEISQSMVFSTNSRDDIFQFVVFSSNSYDDISHSVLFLTNYIDGISQSVVFSTNSGDILPCDCLKLPSIISFGLPVSLLPLIFPVTTMLSSASFLIMWSKGNVRLFLIIKYDVLVLAASTSQSIVTLAMKGICLSHKPHLHCIQAILNVFIHI